jgi:hypothetical protein
MLVLWSWAHRLFLEDHPGNAGAVAQLSKPAGKEGFLHGHVDVTVLSQQAINA